MKKKILIIILAAVTLIQLLVPIAVIRQKYDILENGTEYKFRVSAYAVGKKVKFDVIGIDGSQYKKGEKYGIISVGEDGFARILKMTTVRPVSGYVISKSSRNFEFPVNSLKLNSRAYESLFHKIYDYGSEIYITVRIKDGRAVLENFFVADKTLEEYLKQESEKS